MTPRERRLYSILEKLLFSARKVIWKRCLEHTRGPHATCRDCGYEAELMDAYCDAVGEAESVLDELDQEPEVKP